MYLNKEHLTDGGFEKIIKLREEIRKMGKKARTYFGNSLYYKNR
jgi:hypothetical protein